MASKPVLSIIIAHYQGTIDDKAFKRCMDSLKQDGDFEVILYHDGPLLHDINKLPPKTKLYVTSKRYNDWGHSLRHLGIKRAKGEYLLFSNSDNKFYPVLDTLCKAIKEDQADTYILPIKLMGVIAVSTSSGRFRLYRTYSPKDSYIMVGQARLGMIDCMQFVMKRKLWLKHGGWYNKKENSDGIMYEKFGKLYPPTNTDLLIGEHW